MIIGNFDQAVFDKLHSNGLMEHIDDAYRQMEETGQWPGEWNVAMGALKAIIGDREPTTDEKRTASESVNILCGLRVLAPEVEALIQQAADEAIARDRRPYSLELPDHYVQHVDEAVGGVAGWEGGRQLRTLPLSRISFVIEGKLGTHPTDPLSERLAATLQTVQTGKTDHTA